MGKGRVRGLQLLWLTTKGQEWPQLILAQIPLSGYYSQNGGQTRGTGQSVREGGWVAQGGVLDYFHRDVWSWDLDLTHIGVWSLLEILPIPV